MSENLYQPTGIWADDTYVYIAERGGGLTIASMDMEIVAQLGFYNSPIRAPVSYTHLPLDDLDAATL